MQNDGWNIYLQDLAGYAICHKDVFRLVSSRGPGKRCTLHIPKASFLPHIDACTLVPLSSPSMIASSSSSVVVPASSSSKKTALCLLTSSTKLLCRLKPTEPNESCLPRARLRSWTLLPLTFSQVSFANGSTMRLPSTGPADWLTSSRSTCLRSPSRMTLSIFSLLLIYLILGQQLRCPAINMRPSRAGLGSLRIFQKSLKTLFGQIVIVPLKRCSQISLQSCPSGFGSSSRCRRILRYFCRSSLMDVSIEEPRKPPRQPRPRRCVTGRPGEPRGAKKNRLMCGFTCETMGKLTLKCRLRALSGMSVRRLPSFHLWPKE